MRYRFNMAPRKMGQITTLMCGAALLTACQTTPANKYIHADARPHIKTMDSVLIAKQNTVGADIKTSKLSQYVQGHIIPVLFDVGLNTYRSHKAKEYVTPVRETLGGYDYTADIREEFNLALAESGLEGADDLKILRREPYGFRTAMIQHSKADAVMFIDVKYAFTPKFDNLNLTSSVFVYPINPELDPYKETPDRDRVIEYSDNIYRNNFMASIPVPEAEISEGGVSQAEGVIAGEDEAEVKRKNSENAAMWAQMSEEALTEKLQKAATELAGAIAADLNVDEPDEIEIEPQDDHDEYLKKEPILIDASFTQAAPAAEL